MNKLAKKLLLLAAMSLTLGLAAFTNLGSSPSAAAPCCSDCEALFSDCASMEPGPQADRCWRRYESCARWCYFGC